MMKEKNNIAKLLKDCPSGMELDCTICDNVYFDEVTPYMIRCYIKNDTENNTIYFHNDGSYLTYNKAKCVIFPKGKTTWEDFKRPFKDGDILTNKRGSICIYKGPMYYNKQLIDFYCGYRISDIAFVLKRFNDEYFGDISEYRLATEEEKEKLFQSIKDNGYRWNEETKTLERLVEPKFKVGDRIRLKENHNYIYTITGITKEGNKYGCDVTFVLRFSEQDDWELVPDKFDITTLKPFDKVLVRTDVHSPIWSIDFYDGYNPNAFIKDWSFGVSGGKYFQQCIPYEGNEHLRGTTNDCDNYFKNW